MNLTDFLSTNEIVACAQKKCTYYLMIHEDSYTFYVLDILQSNFLTRM